MLTELQKSALYTISNLLVSNLNDALSDMNADLHEIYEADFQTRLGAISAGKSILDFPIFGFLRPKTETGIVTRKQSLLEPKQDDHVRALFGYLSARLATDKEKVEMEKGNLDDVLDRKGLESEHVAKLAARKDMHDNYNKARGNLGLAIKHNFDGLSYVEKESLRAERNMALACIRSLDQVVNFDPASKNSHPAFLDFETALYNTKDNGKKANGERYRIADHLITSNLTAIQLSGRG